MNLVHCIMGLQQKAVPGLSYFCAPATSPTSEGSICLYLNTISLEKMRTLV